jgi:hypothetical protein
MSLCWGLHSAKQIKPNFVIFVQFVDKKLYWDIFAILQ